MSVIEATIRLKQRLAGGGAVGGAPAALATSELFYNHVDHSVWVGRGDNGSGVATSIEPLVRAAEPTVFRLVDYLHPADLALAYAGVTATQDQTRVTQAVQTFHDAAMAYFTGAPGRRVQTVYPAAALALNGEMFSEAFATALWNLGPGYNDSLWIFDWNGVRWCAKSWIARSSVRSSGLYAARGIAYAVPQCMFRWEQNALRTLGPIMHGRVFFEGEGNPATDPIGMKIRAANTFLIDAPFIRDLRNYGLIMEASQNGTVVAPDVVNCGYQPTEFGGAGFLPSDVTFTNVGNVVTASQPVFESGHAGLGFFLGNAGPRSTQLYTAHYSAIASVDGPSQITLATTPFRNVTDTTGSFEAVAASTTAGSTTVILSRSVSTSLVGRYAYLAGCGQTEIADDNVGALFAVVTAHSGNQITLAHAPRLTRSNIPITFGVPLAMVRAAENYSVGARNNDITIVNARLAHNTTPSDGISPVAIIQHTSEVSFLGGSKFHGASSRRKNNFGSGFANILMDGATLVRGLEISMTHGGFSSRFGNIIQTGGFIESHLGGAQVIFPESNVTATFYDDTIANPRAARTKSGFVRTDGRVPGAVAVRLGPNAAPGRIVAANSIDIALRGVGDGAEDDDTPPDLLTGALSQKGDFSTDLDDVLVRGDLFAGAYGSTLAQAAAAATAGWVPRNNAVYVIEGLPYRGSTGATDFPSTPGLVWRGYKTNAITLAAPAITLGSGQRISWQTSGDVEQAYLLANATQIDAVVGGANALRVTSGGVQVTGLMTGTAVTQSTVDTTANRLLRVGASPLQLSASPALRVTVGGTANARTLTSGAGLTSIPVGLQLRFRAPAVNTGAATINLDGLGAQPCVTVTGAALPAGYIRTDRDTVALWDGTNWVLGREIETGSNANGAYTRFANGLQICRQTISAGSGIAVGYGTLADPYATVAFNWTFPAAFAAAPEFTGSAGFDGATLNNRMFSLTHRATSTTSATGINAVRLSSSSVDVSVTARVTAVGNWY